MSKRKPCEDAPLFLKKTFQMLEQSSGALVHWTDSGESFVITDPDAFAEQVIPLYFKHNNFSSFVRQLNFYGFRKVKGDGQDKSAWEFKHEKFMQNRPDLLSEIRRKSYAESTGIDRVEFDSLRSTVDSIKEDIEQVQDKMQMLMQLVEQCCTGDGTSSDYDDFEGEDEQEPLEQAAHLNTVVDEKMGYDFSQRQTPRERHTAMDVCAGVQDEKPVFYRSPASIAQTFTPPLAVHMKDAPTVASPARVDVSEYEDIMALSPISHVEEEDLDLLDTTLDKEGAVSAQSRPQNLQAKFDDEASLQAKLAALSTDQQDEIVNQLVSCVLAEGGNRPKLLETLQATLRKVANGEAVPQRQHQHQHHRRQQQQQQHQSQFLQQDRDSSPRFHDMSHQEQKMNVVYS